MHTHTHIYIDIHIYYSYIITIYCYYSYIMLLVYHHYLLPHHYLYLLPLLSHHCTFYAVPSHLSCVLKCLCPILVLISFIYFLILPRQLDVYFYFY